MKINYIKTLWPLTTVVDAAPTIRIDPLTVDGARVPPATPTSEIWATWSPPKGYHYHHFPFATLPPWLPPRCAVVDCKWSRLEEEATVTAIYLAPSYHLLAIHRHCHLPRPFLSPSWQIATPESLMYSSTHPIQNAQFRIC